MAQIINFNLSYDEYLELSDKALNGGDLEKSVSYIRKAIELNDKEPSAYIALAGN